MAVDNTIGHGAPGIAEFSSETWGNVKELRLSDTPAAAFDKVVVNNTTGAQLDLPIYSVIRREDGLLALQTEVGGAPAGILTAPVSLGIGETATLDMIVAGNFDIDALNWDATFDTDAEKLAAFRGADAPVNIILGKNPHTSDAIYS